MAPGERKEPQRGPGVATSSVLALLVNWRLNAFSLFLPMGQIGGYGDSKTSLGRSSLLIFSNQMIKSNNEMAPSPAQPLSGKGVRRISPSPGNVSTTESAGSVEGSIGPAHDQTQSTHLDIIQTSQASETLKAKVPVQKVDYRVSSADYQRHKRTERSEARGMDMFTGADRYDRHYIIKAVDSTPLSTVNTIRAYEELKDHIRGTPKRITERRDGGLTITVDNREQSERLKTLTTLAEVSIEVTSDSNLNRTQGTIRYENHPGFTNQQLLDTLKPQNVVEIYQLSKRNDDKTSVPIPVFILTFGTTKIPDKVNIGWTSCSVRMYIPRPRRCFKCHRFGHGANTCRSPQDICGKCGKTTHEGTCIDALCCVNCKGPHPSYIRTCPAYQKEQEILAHKARNNTTYNEAKAAVGSNYPRENTTYSQVLMNSYRAENIEQTVSQEQTNGPSAPRRETAKLHRSQSLLERKRPTYDENNNGTVTQSYEKPLVPYTDCNDHEMDTSKTNEQTHEADKSTKPKRQRESNTPPKSKSKGKPHTEERSFPIKMKLPAELPKKKHKGNQQSSGGRHQT